MPHWFDVDARVDRKLLKNLSSTVTALTNSGIHTDQGTWSSRTYAQLLLGQILFISYLEHRHIIGPVYRETRSVEPLHELVSSCNQDGIQNLLCRLREDFNGDFLIDDSHDPWSHLNETGYDLLDQFLNRTDMSTGQQDFWNYDFSHIPVELLSGIYESFLSEEQDRDSAYYTPRHLAALAVDQALSMSSDPLSETVFDGACGSGILLTTAYRRLIALSEARNGRQLGFSERAALLTERIFGADINPMACRVTAFSLYLSLLESLDPADIIEAQEREQARLPKLSDDNLHHGTTADIFATNHAFETRRFSIIISNPPWKEPEGEEKTSADHWATSKQIPFVRRQIAGAYALRALDFLSDDGRLCLILPISLFLAPTSSEFVEYLLKRVQPNRLINFGDLQNLLFPTTEHTCHLFVGNQRSSAKAGLIPFDETFDYCVPKADMSLAYGRLAVQSTDRHSLQTITAAQEPRLLTTLMWGDASDLNLWTRLTSLGTFRDFCKGPKKQRRWVARKGVHLHDKSREPVSSFPLRDRPHVTVTSLGGRSPLLPPDLLTTWPDDEETVVGLNDDLLRMFDGPRVLFPDGFSRRDTAIRAAYVSRPATFTVSIGAIAGPEADARLLQFAAVYLRSSLARYFLMMNSWKMLCERNAVHLRDILQFPFFMPEDAPNPEAAHMAINRVVLKIQHLAGVHSFGQDDEYETLRGEFDEDVFSFFSITEIERALVRETINTLLPSIRPRSFSSLDTPAQSRASRKDLDTYGGALSKALADWRVRMRGKGEFNVSTVANRAARAAALGIVRIEYVPNGHVVSSAIHRRIDDEIVQSTLAELRALGLTMVPSGHSLYLLPDIHIWSEEVLYLIRPLISRLWTQRQAMRDAENIVRAVHNRHSPFNGSEAA
ncbi:MAG: N-6 DNA methylase [Chloroflexi bacterium]|nr:N-6 DNA methylase [Chloroflexota bacterium]